jgi:hypothetical protein
LPYKSLQKSVNAAFWHFVEKIVDIFYKQSGKTWGAICAIWRIFRDKLYAPHVYVFPKSHEGHIGADNKSCSDIV